MHLRLYQLSVSCIFPFPPLGEGKGGERRSQAEMQLSGPVTARGQPVLLVSKVSHVLTGWINADSKFGFLTGLVCEPNQVSLSS